MAAVTIRPVDGGPLPAPVGPLPGARPLARPATGAGAGGRSHKRQAPADGAREIALSPEEFAAFEINREALRRIYANYPALVAQYDEADGSTADVDSMTPIEIEARLRAARNAPGAILDKRIVESALAVPTAILDARWGLDGSLSKEVAEDLALAEAVRIEMTAASLSYFSPRAKIALLYGVHVGRGYLRAREQATRRAALTVRSAPPADILNDVMGSSGGEKPAAISDRPAGLRQEPGGQ